MQMRREPIPQLTSIRRQIQRHLLQLLHHHLPRALITAKLSIGELFPLSDAADNRPHEQIGNIDRHGLREAGEFGRVGTDGACVSGGVEG